MISQSPQGGTQATKGRTVTLTVSQGAEGIEVPRLTGLQREEAEQQLNGLGLTADVTEEESTSAPGTVTEQDPAAGTSVEKGAAVKLTVAKARPEVPDVTTGNPTVEEATQTLEEAGFKVATDPRPDPALAGRVIDQRPEAGTPRSTGGTVTPRRRRGRTAARDADRRRHEGRGPGGRALVRARRLAALRRIRARGRRGGRPRGAGGDDRARGRVDVSTASPVTCAPAAVCSAPTRCSPCCTGRSARTGRCRGCWNCSTCPTSAPACSPRRCAWTRWCSRTCWPPPASRRCPTWACARRAGGRRRMPSGASWRRWGRLCSSSPLGSARRSGSPR